MTVPKENSPTFAAVTREAVTQEIIDLVQAEVGAVDLTADSTLDSTGLDSIKVISFVFKIEARYDINVDEEDADDLHTIGDLADMVVRHVQERP
jgi:acyl carrier protein